MDISSIILHIESLIFASDRPLTTLEITDLINLAFGFMEDKVTPEQIDAAINGVVEKYSSEFYPFEVRQSGGGWQFLTKKDYFKTLAIIAYKQPITKGEIEAIRGVSTDYSIQKLLEKELIVITGRNEKLPGHPLVYSTSRNFMDYFGINSPEDLPKIREVLADQVVQPTVVQGTAPEESETFLVSNDGELIQRTPEEEQHLNGHSFHIGEEAGQGEIESETTAEAPEENAGEENIQEEAPGNEIPATEDEAEAGDPVEDEGEENQDDLGNPPADPTQDTAEEQ
jgi:segregation and condensation protein B